MEMNWTGNEASEMEWKLTGLGMKLVRWNGMGMRVNENREAT